MSAPGPTGERQEHLDAIVAFAGAGQRRRLFRHSDNQVGDRRLAGGLSLLAQYAVDVPERRTGTRPRKQFDDDEWTRSLAEAQEATTDIPEDGVTYDQQDIDPQKG